MTISVESGIQEKESEFSKMMDKHAVSFQKSITNVTTIIDKYNKNNKELTVWWDMKMSKICITDQNILIGYLKLKGDSKLTTTPAAIQNRLIEDIRKGMDHTLKDYLVNKGRSQDDINTFLDRIKEQERMEAATAMSGLFHSPADDNEEVDEELEDTGVDSPLDISMCTV